MACSPQYKRPEVPTAARTLRSYILEFDRTVSNISVEFEERDCCLSTELQRVATQKMGTLQLTQTQHPLFSVTAIRLLLVPEYAFIVIAEQNVVRAHRSWVSYELYIYICFFCVLYTKYNNHLEKMLNHGKTNEERKYFIYRFYLNKYGIL
jgi:hypothetical protein